MKIFRQLSCNKDGKTALYSRGCVSCLPDNALLIRKRPFFIPDFAHRCTVQLYAAVKICRLGRSIHAQFARRYYEAEHLTLAACFTAADLLDRLKADGEPWDRALGFDDAIAVAETFPTAETLQGTPTACLELGETHVDAPFPTEELLSAFDRMLMEISEYYTMRQGDILLIPLSPEETEVHIGDHLRLMLEDEEMTSFNIK